MKCWHPGTQAQAEWSNRTTLVLTAGKQEPRDGHAGFHGGRRHQEHVLKQRLPLVGHCKTFKDAKRDSCGAPWRSSWVAGEHSCAVLCLVAQLCLTLCDPMDCSPPGSSVMGILQARILEWVAMPSSRRSSQLGHQTQVSHIAGGFFTVLRHQGSSRIREWVAYPFSTESPQPRNWTRVSFIAGGFFTSWATREA